MNIKRILTGRYYRIIIPPSLFISRPLTLPEAKKIAASFPGNGNLIVRDISDGFTERYLKKTYPIDNPFDGRVIILK